MHAGLTAVDGVEVAADDHRPPVTPGLRRGLRVTDDAMMSDRIDDLVRVS